MKKPSKRDIYRKGENLGGWPCDQGPDGTETNGSVERLMYYEGSYYFVYTGFFDGPVYGFTS
jgi:hypothetical protein